MDSNTYINNYETIIKLICENNELKSTNSKLKSENMIIYNKSTLIWGQIIKFT